jgi:YidC/Oxa1 family membrane protein insertase
MLDFFSSIGSAIMAPLYFVTSAILFGWHWLFENVFSLGANSGWTWALSIVGLTLTIRFALIPLFVKQIKTSRNMALVQPQVKELQKKYGHDRERLAQETMKLYQETGTNPFASCMPLLLQMPIFLSLFRLVEQAAKKGDDYEKFFLTSDLSESLQNAVFLGAKIAETFISGEAGVRALAAVLVVAMTATTFLTQRQLMQKNMPPDALTGPYAQQQKVLLYVLPFAFGIGGIFFPIGVLLYWTTSNLWTMGQQFYVIRRNPAPGTPAFTAKQERDAKRGKSAPTPETPVVAPVETRPPVASSRARSRAANVARPRSALLQPRCRRRRPRRRRVSPRPLQWRLQHRNRHQAVPPRHAAATRRAVVNHAVAVEFSSADSVPNDSAG